MLKSTFQFALILLVLPLALWSTDLGDPISYIGYTINDIFKLPESVEEIYPNRGITEAEDNVVFYYTNGFYLFLFANRVWQVRYDRTHSHNILGLRIGESLQDILLKKGSPFLSDKDKSFIVYQLQEDPYEIRMKLFFEVGILDDIYIYRADF